MAVTRAHLRSSLNRVVRLLELLNAPGKHDPIEAGVYEARQLLSKTNESPMKPNKPHEWQITLSGNHADECLQREFFGTIEGALAEADELECQPDWDVLGVHVIRRAKT